MCAAARKSTSAYPELWSNIAKNAPQKALVQDYFYIVANILELFCGSNPPIE